MARAYKHVHIVGCAPRTGTTLMAELMVNGFRVDAFAEHEISCFVRPARASGVVVTKNPVDIVTVRPLISMWPHFWVLCMVRDPRDVVVSRHRGAPGRYYVGLNLWKEGYRLARRLARHPRVRLVRYEDLVGDPDGTQDRIDAWLPFLTRKARFSDFHQVAQPSAHSAAALGGVRPISDGSRGGWRGHKPRLAAQLERHGSIAEELIELGYEADTEWLRELEGVAPENGSSYMPESLSMTRDWDWRIWRWRNTLRACLGMERRAPLPGGFGDDRR